MSKSKPLPLKPTSIKFTDKQKAFLKRLSLKQQHGRVSIVVKKMIDREMEMQGVA